MNLTQDLSTTLNELVRICLDGAKGFAAASELIDDARLKAELLAYSSQRQDFASELQSLVAGQGDSPAKSGDATAALHRGWMSMATALSRNDRYAVLAECERGEDAALKAYRNALKLGLSNDVAEVVERQSIDVQWTHDRIKILRDASKIT